MSTPVRTLVAWCLDWPIVALGHPLDEPVAVMFANRIVAASPAAREQGVARGMRRRVAQALCPGLVLADRDEAREVRQFEPVVATLDDITPRIEVNRPGYCGMVMRGPSRYFGGEAAVAGLVEARLTEVLAGRTEVRIGVADGPFAAGLAARSALSTDPIRVIEPGGTPAFLRPLPVTVLERDDLCDVVQRLGLETLGDFSDLPAADVLARFGEEGRAAHRLASGLDERALDTRLPSPDWAVRAEIDPPADLIDRVAFCARTLAEELHTRLAEEGVACTRIAIEAETEHGEELIRLWRHEGALNAAAISDRVRWQLDGWLHGSAASRPTGGITRVVLSPDEVVPARGRQLGFWGGESEADERAARAAVRLQGQLGPDAVRVPEVRGGRHPDEQLVLVPAGAVELRGRSLVSSDECSEAPWPGRLPRPSPARILARPVPVGLVAADGARVSVTGRGLMSGSPCRLIIDGRPHRVAAWSGPWPVDERWWDGDGHRRVARFQILTSDGLARLVTCEHGQWSMTAVWD
jgi:protein ImuB